MKTWKPTCLLAALVAAFALAPNAHATVIRTLAYHQLTTLPYPGVCTDPRSAAISANGSKIAFATWTGYPYTNQFYTINFDGTDLTLVDSWESKGGLPRVDISADGSKVLAYDASLVRIMNADGSNPQDVIEVTSGVFTPSDFRLSALGDKVFFAVAATWQALPYTNINRECGLYWVNADGTELTMIVGISQVETNLGVNPGEALLAYGQCPELAVSGNGTRLLFAVAAAGMHLLRVNSDGSGLQEYSLPLATGPSIYDFGISGDGRRVFYEVERNSPPGLETGVMNFDGGDRVILSTKGGTTAHAQLTRDGSKLLANFGCLYNSDGSGALELNWGYGQLFPPDHKLYVPIMNGNATRFVYRNKEGGFNPPFQVVTMEMNPATLGLAPQISEMSANPPYLATNMASSTLFSCFVSPTNDLHAGGVNAGIFTNGLPDPDIGPNTGWLQDLGGDGDVTAGDGIYSRTFGVWDTPVGPRMLRFVAELGPIDGKYHATAVDIAPFSIIADAPSGDPPAITSITPSNAPPGTQVTLTGTGFEPIAQNNYVLFGNTPAYVVSASGGTELTVIVPDLPPGSVSVTVTAFGQTSSGTAFTVVRSEVSLSVMLTGTNTVVVYWPSPSTGWELKQNTDLNTTNWETPPETVNDNGTHKFIVVDPPTGSQFYRLHKP